MLECLIYVGCMQYVKFCFMISSRWFTGTLRFLFDYMDVQCHRELRVNLICIMKHRLVEVSCEAQREQKPFLPALFFDEKKKINWVTHLSFKRTNGKVWLDLMIWYIIKSGLIFFAYFNVINVQIWNFVLSHCNLFSNVPPPLPLHKIPGPPLNEPISHHLNMLLL